MARRLGGDLWLAICGHLHARPHAVFRVMMAVKAANEAGRGAEAWWGELFGRALAYQDGLRRSHYAKQLVFFGRAQARRALRAVFAPRCDGCGAARGHRLLLPYAVRACRGCLQTRVVSNAALVAEYGVRFGDFAERYCEEKGLLFFVPGGGLPRHGRNTVLLWRPHVERILPLRPLAGAGAAVARLWAALQRAKARHDAERRRLLLVAAFDGGAAYYYHSSHRDETASSAPILGAGRCDPARLLELLQRAPRVKKGVFSFIGRRPPARI